MTPMNKNVMVIPSTTETKEEGGIIIPDSAAGLKFGIVSSVGPKVEDVTEGDKVLLPKGDLMEVDYEGTKYIVIPEEAIVAIV